jgi:hypothetical protein
MGVTPTRGADTPAYRPRASPSFAMVRRTTSMAPLYTPFSAVCMRTLTRSNGCPTTTAQMPPTPPAASARSDCSEDLLASLMSSFNSSLEGRFSALSGLLVGAIEWWLQRRRVTRGGWGLRQD